MTIAVIKTGGKQYIVSPHAKIRIEKIAGKEGDTVEFPHVLLAGDETVTLGKPVVAGVVVKGKIVKQGLAKKVRVEKYKPKKRYHVRRGHRQPFTEVTIESIQA